MFRSSRCQSLSAVVAVVGAAAAGSACKPPIVPPPVIAESDPVYEKIARTADEGDVAPEAAPPLATLPAIEPTASAGKARTTLARKQARAVEVSPDGVALAFYGLGPTWVVTPERPDGFRVDRRSSKARFSPDHSKLALLTQTGVTVISTATGREVMKWPGGDATFEIESWRWEARFVTDREMLMFDGCRLWIVDGEGSSTVGSDVCGEPRASGDGRRWLIMTIDKLGLEARKRHDLPCPPTCQSIRGLYAVDPASGAAIEVWASKPGEVVLHDLAVSPDLKWYCASVSDTGHRLVCRAFDASEEIAIWDGITDGRATFDATGERLVFGAGRPNKERPIHVVDFAARTVQHVGTARADEDRYVFASRTRLITTGGEQIFVYDLEAGTKRAVGTPGEWEGFAVVPGQDARFLIGSDQQSSRDFFWVELDE